MRSCEGVHSSRLMAGSLSARAPDERPLVLEAVGDALVLVGRAEGAQRLGHAPVALEDAAALATGARLRPRLAQRDAELLDARMRCVVRRRLDLRTPIGSRRTPEESCETRHGACIER